MDVKTLVAQMQSFEIENKMYEGDLAKVWKSVRTNFYYSIQKDLGIFSEVKPSASIKHKINSAFRVLLNCIFHRARILPSQKQLVIQHPRTNKKGELAIDSYSFEYTRKFSDTALFLHRSSLGEQQKYLHDISASLDNLLVLKLFSRHQLKDEEVLEAKALIGNLCRKVGVDSNKYIQLFLKAIIEFKVEEKYFNKLLAGTSIETVYLVDHYSKNVPLISVCKALGIKVVEYQHGIISKYHLGYSVLQPRLNWPCYPDLFLAWGDHWVNSTVLPDSVDVSYIEPAYRHKRNVVEKKNQLLVVSQSVIGKRIADFVLNSIDDGAFDKVIFKLHPSEVDLLEEYKNVFSNTDVLVSTSDIYPLLNDSKAVLGVFSTVMLEAVDFDCDVFFIDLPGAEYLKTNNCIKDVRQQSFYVD